MKNHTYALFLLLIFFSATLLLNSCNKDEDDATGIDKELFDKAKSSTGFVWYKNSTELLEKSSGSGHNFPFLRTRYNSVAASQLDSNGKINEGAIFSEGSLIVKELFSNANDIGRYAILYKSSGHESADANGWVWGYVNADESVAYAASEKGDGCISCHQQSGSIDYMLMNTYFP